MRNDSPHNRDKRLSDHKRSPSTAIIVGIDGSESSWDAFWWAIGDARRLDSRLIAVFVSPTVDSKAAMAATFPGAAFDYAGVEQIASDLAQVLRDRVEDYSAEQNIPLRFFHAHGDPVAELTRIAEEFGADVIVVGKSTKARHQIAGSLGRRLIGRRNSSVVVVVP
jgi:nucleotide-binding universal stress UspA family protein